MATSTVEPVGLPGTMEFQIDGMGALQDLTTTTRVGRHGKTDGREMVLAVDAVDFTGPRETERSNVATSDAERRRRRRGGRTKGLGLRRALTREDEGPLPGEARDGPEDTFDDSDTDIVAMARELAEMAGVPRDAGGDGRLLHVVDTMR